MNFISIVRQTLDVFTLKNIKNHPFFKYIPYSSQYIEYPLLIKHVDYHRLLLITCNMDEDVFQDHKTITTSDVFFLFLGEFFSFNSGQFTSL